MTIIIPGKLGCGSAVGGGLLKPKFNRGVVLGNQQLLGTLNLTTADWLLFKLVGIDHLRVGTAGSLAFTDLTFTTFNETVMRRVDKLIDTARQYGIRVIIDCHPILGTTDPLANTVARINQYWSMMIGRYGHYDDMVYWEVLNEPDTTNFPTGTAWQTFHNNTVAYIRTIDPLKTRPILVDAQYTAYPTGFDNVVPITNNGVRDPYIIYSFHYYEPFPFTHQMTTFTEFKNFSGVSYPTDHTFIDNLFVLYDPSGKSTSRTVDYNAAQILLEFQHPKIWANKYGVPLHCGEFGVWQGVGYNYGVNTWFQDVINAAKATNTAYTFFVYGGNFPITNVQLNLPH